MSDVSLRVAVTGASGLIGSALVERLAEEGHQILRMVRRPPRGAGEAQWDPDAEHFDAGALNGVDAVVHLAGESVVGRWTAEKKAAIRRSRIHSTRILADGLARLADPPRVLACASAVGFYGDRG
ncbi:MAG TPA: NAD-dependent epimerase/dehydratase family protein, partial [Longimicrobium sp.]|nr:NAD-dependent epimerase/dehydratase family protein [Longimicrobium sp.]